MRPLFSPGAAEMHGYLTYGQQELHTIRQNHRELLQENPEDAPFFGLVFLL